MLSSLNLYLNLYFLNFDAQYTVWGNEEKRLSTLGKQNGTTDRMVKK